MFRILTVAVAAFAMLTAAPVRFADAQDATASTDGTQQSSASTDPAATGSTDGTQQSSASDDPAAVVAGGPAQSTGSAAPVVGYGVFREIRVDAPVNQRNCWVQGMIDGQVIRGDLLAERVTYQQAQCVLLQSTRRGLCSNQRTNPLWSARPEDNSASGTDPWAGNAVGVVDQINLDVPGWNHVHGDAGRRPHGNRDSGGIDPNAASGGTTDASGSADGSASGTANGSNGGGGNGRWSGGSQAQTNWAALGCSANGGQQGHHQWRGASASTSTSTSTSTAASGSAPATGDGTTATQQ